MKLETEHLNIFPLTYNQMLLYVRDNEQLEKELKLAPNQRIVSPEMKTTIIENILPQIDDKRNNPLFHTFWTLVNKSQNVMVGDLCFKGEPNAKGEVEIGYATYQPFRKKGYMTEAIGAISKWALEQPRVKVVTAETWQANIASQRALEKNNFIRYNESELGCWWKLETPNI